MTKKVIVIGSGLGGISAAISMATEGYEVELFEKNNKIGGKLNYLERDGFKFDLGPSIFTMPHIFNELFEKANRNMEDYFELISVEPHWRNFFEDGKTIDLIGSNKNDKFRGVNISDEDNRELENFLTYSKKTYDLVEKGYFDKGLDTFWENLNEYGVYTLLKDMNVLNSMDSKVKKYITNSYLRDIVNFFVKYVGSSPYQSPSILNLLPYIQFRYGLWYVKGGMYNLAKGLEQLMRELEITINLNTEVKSIIKDNNSVKGILTDNNDKITGDIVISNMEVIPTYKYLLNEDDRYLKKFNRFEPACSGLVIHIGVKKKYNILAHHNFFFSKNPRKHFDDIFNKKKLPDDPTIYLVAPMRTDKSQGPEGYDNIKILPHIPYIQKDITEHDYMILKEKIYDKLERMGLKNLRENIIFEEILNPYDIEKMYYSNKGSIYGVISDIKKNLALKASKQSNKYKNLFFVGGSVNPGGGMPMTVLSGINVKNKIVNINKG